MSLPEVWHQEGPVTQDDTCVSLAEVLEDSLLIAELFATATEDIFLEVEQRIEPLMSRTHHKDLAIHVSSGAYMMLGGRSCFH